MVLVREELKKPGAGTSVIGAQQAMRLLKRGSLGSSLIALSKVAAAEHLARVAAQEGKR